MTPRREIKQIELLSTYLDDQLSKNDRADLESRLAVDPKMQEMLDELRITRGVLRSLPMLKAPRNFTLSPEMVGIRKRTPRMSIAMGLASAAASFLLVLTIAGDVLFTAGLPAAMRSEAEPAMQYFEAEGLVEELPAEMDAVEAPLAAASATDLEVEKSVDTLADAGDDEFVERATSPEENEVQESVGEAGAAEPEALAGFEASAPTQTQLPAADQIIVEETASPIPTQVTEAIPQPTVLPIPPAPLQPEARERIPVVRVIEIGLAGVALITGTIALILRRKGTL